MGADSNDWKLGVGILISTLHLLGLGSCCGLGTRQIPTEVARSPLGALGEGFHVPCLGFPICKGEDSHDRPGRSATRMQSSSADSSGCCRATESRLHGDKEGCRVPGVFLPTPHSLRGGGLVVMVWPSPPCRMEGPHVTGACVEPAGGGNPQPHHPSSEHLDVSMAIKGSSPAIKAVTRRPHLGDFLWVFPCVGALTPFLFLLNYLLVG